MPPLRSARPRFGVGGWLRKVELDGTSAYGCRGRDRGRDPCGHGERRRVRGPCEHGQLALAAAPPASTPAPGAPTRVGQYRPECATPWTGHAPRPVPSGIETGGLRSRGPRGANYRYRDLGPCHRRRAHGAEHETSQPPQPPASAPAGSPHGPGVQRRECNAIRETRRPPASRPLRHIGTSFDDAP